MGKKIAHLEMVQGVVSRLAQNSLTLKELSVGIVSAIFALTASKEVVSRDLCFIAFLPALTFWWLDAYFLCQERRFRRLFNAVRAKEEDAIDFSMDTSPHCKDQEGVFRLMWSKTLALFHGTIILAIIVFATISILKLQIGG